MFRYTIAVFLISVFSSTHGQRFNSYVQAGVVTSQVSGDALGGFDKAGIEGGIGVITPVSKSISVALELTFIQKGSRKPSKLDQGDPSQYLMRLNYLEVPVTASYRIQKLKLDVYLGIAAAYLLNSYEENENGELTYNLPFNSTDISVTGGLRYALAKHLQVDFRGIQSVFPVREFGGKAAAFFDGGQYNSAVVLMFGYYFKSLKND
jgi:hypothetical protein